MLTIDLFEKWSNKYKKSINCANPKGFSQKAHCAGRKKHNESVDHKEPELIQALRSFLPIVVKHLKLKSLPKIHLQKQVNDVHVASFGGYDDDKQAVTLVINNRQPADILRTLAHELVHWSQGQNGQINTDSWKDGSNLENEANAVAGVIMREFARQCPECLEYAPIKLESTVSGCDAWVVGGPITEGKHCDAKNAVPELKAALTKRKTELKNADAKVAYDKIDKIMTRIAQTYNISGQKLHDLWTERYGEIPDTWVLGENFADGKGPGRPGDSQRHGISKGATMAELEKAAKASGRKGQLARWQINMRRGKKK